MKLLEEYCDVCGSSRLTWIRDQHTGDVTGIKCDDCEEWWEDHLEWDRNR